MSRYNFKSSNSAPDYSNLDYIGDINLYYLNIRENVEQRVNAYFRTR